MSYILYAREADPPTPPHTTHVSLQYLQLLRGRKTAVACKHPGVTLLDVIAISCII